MTNPYQDPKPCCQLAHQDMIEAKHYMNPLDRKVRELIAEAHLRYCEAGTVPQVDISCKIDLPLRIKDRKDAGKDKE